MSSAVRWTCCSTWCASTRSRSSTFPSPLITDQYLEYLAVLEQLDVDAVGDFLAMASTLIEIKSQQVLPRSDEIEEEIDDPRQELVRRLLEYKKYRDAASMLEERSRSGSSIIRGWPPTCPPARNLAEEPIQEVELWDLVSAFGRIMRDTEALEAVEHRLRRHADPRLHGADPRAAAGARAAVLPRAVRAGHAQIEAGRHLPGRAGAGAAPPRPRRAERPVRRNLDPARPRTAANLWTCRKVDNYEHAS